MRRWSGTVTAGLGLLLAAAILSLAFPRSVASFIMLPDNAALARLKQPQPAELQPEQLASIAASRRRALDWIDDGDVYGDMALALLLDLAKRQEAAGQAAPSQGEASELRAILEKSLARAPTNPHGWTQLAYASALSQASTDRVISLLTMSLYTGPYEPRLVFPRLRLLLDAWDVLTSDQRDLVFRQARFAWDVSRVRLVELATPMEKAKVNVIRVALAQDPSNLASFERRLRWSRIKALEQQNDQGQQQSGEEQQQNGEE